jgi:hypothetical protein
LVVLLKKLAVVCTGVLLLRCAGADATQSPAITAPDVPLQPLAQHARRVESTLRELGQALATSDRQAIDAAISAANEQEAVQGLQQTLDKYVVAVVRINPESRVSVDPGPGKPELIEGGTRLFLVKVLNEGGITAPLRVQSPNSGNVYVTSNGSPQPEARLTSREVRDRWAGISIYDKPPMAKRLSGLGVEYAILEIFSRDAGQRSAEISFDVGQGTQDIGHRNTISVLFTALPARDVTFRVRDENGRTAVASFVIRDGHDRIYPNKSKRLAPDLPFQSQIYRGDGERIRLPDGDYRVVAGGGPEYLQQTIDLHVDERTPREISVKLARWIDPAKSGWHSGDHHIHAAGCSHYQNPTEGVLPEHMMRQVDGEALNIGAVLTWGPCYYYQKQFFTGEDSSLSKADRRMHYDLEVSGFPSSHAGHLVLLGLKDQDYPQTHRIEDWPSWDLPILKWAKAQGAIVGFAHSGWGLEVRDSAIPSFEMPAFDGIGANEFIVDVTHPDVVDFISTIDTPSVWELSIWYHTLNVGFRTRISGETDFPCIYDSRVGLGRTYAHLEGPLSYAAWLAALRAGRSYVSDGKSHLLDFAVNDVKVGENGSELKLTPGQSITARVRVAARLEETPNEEIRKRQRDQQPYWDIERARIDLTREVPVELIVNGAVVATKRVSADGRAHDVTFTTKVDASSWIAVRILPSSHTNPIFAIVDGKPIRASKRSAEWCLNAVNQCWTQKAPQIRATERDAARAAYDHAREVYRRLITESAISNPKSQLTLKSPNPN